MFLRFLSALMAMLMTATGLNCEQLVIYWDFVYVL